MVIAALNPIERGFFMSRLGLGKLADSIYDLVTMIGEKKVDFIQRNSDDFNELCCEYEFYRQLHDKQLTIYGQNVRYRLTSEYNDIVNNQNERNEIISVVFSIEGAYTFSNNNRKKPVHNQVLSNIDKIKKWKYPPLFVTLCHHFYNHYAGHAASLPFILRLFISQKNGINTGIKNLGKEVIQRLLSNENGRRIYIDIKHMSRKSRKEYYKLLKNNYRTESIPIIVSHGALNGYERVGDFTNRHTRKGNHLFKKSDINFCDDEIIMIAKSNGILGLQIDDRMITTIWEKLKIIFFCPGKKNKLRKRAKLVWNHIKYIAELLDEKGLYAWGITAIGTDFDGMVNPIDGFWTSEEMPLLYRMLYKHAAKYLNDNQFIQERNNISPKKVMDAIFWGNAKKFLQRYYR
jgi:microsomal dipeptidase-like Zn-dependent dipeptidase